MSVSISLAVTKITGIWLPCRTNCSRSRPEPSGRPTSNSARSKGCAASCSRASRQVATKVAWVWPSVRDKASPRPKDGSSSTIKIRFISCLLWPRTGQGNPPAGCRRTAFFLLYPGPFVHGPRLCNYCTPLGRGDARASIFPLPADGRPACGWPGPPPPCGTHAPG